MSKSEEELMKNESKEVIRLKVDGASTAVNTLRDQQTTRGVSLICPFPALEVDVPVNFGKNGEEGVQHGSIHRIGVEDDPETGLPRLRLSIRTCKEIPAPLVIESSQNKDSLDEQETEDLDDAREYPLDMIQVIKENDEKAARAVQTDDIVESEFCPADDILSHNVPISGTDDPAWVDCGDVPLPDEFMERSRTRRRYKYAVRSAWLGMLVVVVVGGYMLERAGFIDTKMVRSYIAGFSMDSVFAQATTYQSNEAVEAKPIKEDLLEDWAPAKAESIALVSDKVEEAKPVEVESINQPSVNIVASAPVHKIEEQPALVLPVDKDVAETEASSPVLEKSNEVLLVLPTRYPVEYATGYRIRNPNGVVIDVPGGLVRNEGWIESLVEHPMIRSVKAIQRETGARFVVHVHGDHLPRFMTSPKTGGVGLRLYGLNDEIVAEQAKVALAD
ncbi:MAG: hypothetical protein GY847_41115 [Proteobacteria bacterium]|nr:hypothetical protein [Pseudomonadota bacterium]